jgi:adenosylcobinamide-GDP ribazoletransferase
MVTVARTGAVRRSVSGARAAIAMLTRLPVGRLTLAEAADLPAAAPWFPLVGIAVGGIAAGVRAAAGSVMGAAAATVLALASAVLVTGALHEDGLADTADAVGARADRARRLEILRDPRLGTFGVTALALALLFSYAALEPFSAGRFARAAVVAHCLARYSPLLQSRLAPAARPDGSGVLLRTPVPALLLATTVAAAAAVGLGQPAPGGTAFGAAVIVTAGAALLARRALGGTTGDTFGAGAKVVELVSYAVFAGFWR